MEPEGSLPFSQEPIMDTHSGRTLAIFERKIYGPVKDNEV
jgi:hypothetical protein